eukprot:328130_1
MTTDNTNQMMKMMHQQIAAKDKQINDVVQQLIAKDKQLQEMVQQIDAKDQQIATKDQQIQDMMVQIDILQVKSEQHSKMSKLISSLSTNFDNPEIDEFEDTNIDDETKQQYNMDAEKMNQYNTDTNDADVDEQEHQELIKMAINMENEHAQFTQLQEKYEKLKQQYQKS